MIKITLKSKLSRFANSTKNNFESLQLILVVIVVLLLSACSVGAKKYITEYSPSTDDGLYLMYQTPTLAQELLVSNYTNIDLVNKYGQVVYHWKIKCPVVNAKVYKNLQIGVACFKLDKSKYDFPFGTYGQFFLLDKYSRIIWSYENPGLHHDFERIDDNNFLFIASRKLAIHEQVALGIVAKKERQLFFTDQIIKVDLKNNVSVFWDSYNLLSKMGTKKFAVPTDIVHLNTIHAYKSNAINNRPNILITSRNLNQIFMLDLETASLIWQSPPYLASFPHDGRLSLGQKVSFFNNGGDEGFFYRSNIKEIDIKTGQLKVITEGSSFLVHIMGGVQPLANGRYLVTHSALGMAFEIDSEFNKTFTIFNRPSETSPKKKRWWSSSGIFKVEKYYWDDIK